MRFLSSLTGFGARDIAVDLGTANTLVYVRGEGIVASEPSVVAFDQSTGDVHAVGDEAQRMIGRTPASITAIRPLRHGVIADFDVTEQMLRYFIRRVGRRRMAAPRMVMCAPSGITAVEERAVQEAALAAGARRVYLIEEPLAAAIGAGLPIEEPVGSMVVDVGGGTTEVAVISLGGIVISSSTPTGGYELDDAIVTHVRNAHGIAIGQPTAEAVKIEIGSAGDYGLDAVTEIRGRHVMSGLPRSVVLTSEEIRQALADPVQSIIGAIKDTLERTPPELAADISEQGILLAGGGALLNGLVERVAEETRMETRLADSPLTCVVLGSGRALAGFEALEANGNLRRQARALR